MKSIRPIFIVIILLTSLTFPVAGQTRTGRGANPSLPSSLRGGQMVRGTPDKNTQGSSARKFITQGQSYLADGRVLEAKEALRTALRLEPMNLEAWGLYDYAVELHYVGRARNDKKNPVIERDLKPTFDIQRIDSYREYDTLYLVGELRNVSGELRQKIELTGVLLDKDRQELRRETGLLNLTSRGLFPNESSLFEIRFRNPPPGVCVYRVRVSRYE